MNYDALQAIMATMRHEMIKACEDCTLRDLCDKAEHKTLPACWGSALGMLDIIAASLERERKERPVTGQPDGEPLKKQNPVTIDRDGLYIGEAANGRDCWVEYSDGECIVNIRVPRHSVHRRQGIQQPPGTPQGSRAPEVPGECET